MTAPAIRVSALSKAYRLAHARARHDTFADALSGWLRRPFRKLGDDTPSEETFWALRDVSFDVQPGEVVGIIGRNGAGKSTLLKILSRITAPTEGRVEIRGRVASLLEVGTGFHPELTGRENIYMNGSILGMTHAEIGKKFDTIVDFAGVQRFLDTPLKRYSSGMQVRLAFAVAAHLEPDVLIVDEVLAVGDHGFQQRSMGKMREATDSGSTVLLVTHNLGAVRALASRAIVLHEGRLAASGGVDACLEHYLTLGGAGIMRAEVRWSRADAPGTESLRCYRVSLVGSRPDSSVEVLATEQVVIELEYEALVELPDLRFHLTFVTEQGELAFRVTDHEARAGSLSTGRYRTRCTLPARLLNQRAYSVLLGAGQPGVRKHIEELPTVSFRVVTSAHGSLYPETWPGVVAPQASWQLDMRVDDTELDPREHAV